MNDKKCWVCEGAEPGLMSHKCEKHDVCDICGKKRSEIKENIWGTRTGYVCFPCEEKRREKAISDFEKEDVAKWEFWGNDNIKCPYCGYEYEPDDLHESTKDEECGNCGSIMEVEVEYTVTYSTSKTE